MTIKSKKIKELFLNERVGSFVSNTLAPIVGDTVKYYRKSRRRGHPVGTSLTRAILQGKQEILKGETKKDGGVSSAINNLASAQRGSGREQRKADRLFWIRSRKESRKGSEKVSLPQTQKSPSDNNN